MKKYLFRELFRPEEVDIITENKKITIKEYDENGNEINKQKTVKEYFTLGPTVLTDEINQNRRIYEGTDMDRALREYNTKFIETNRALGELDHPFDDEKSLYVELKNVSHKFVEYKRDGNYIVSKAKVMTETPNGKIVKSLIDEGVKLGISTRGMGDIEERNGKSYVVNYEFVTMGDYVHDPSAPGAFLDIVKEGKKLLTSFSDIEMEKIKEEERKFEDKYKMNLSSDEKSRIIKEFFDNVKIKLNK